MVRYFFPKYFTSKDAPFHAIIDYNNLSVYKAEAKSYLDIAFRGSGKTSRTKLFIAFCIACDEDHFRKYYKVLTKNLTNSKQIVTDIYNMFNDYRVKDAYPEIFAKTVALREETMSSFTTSTGIKVIADTVGTDQRGQIQESSRPDFIFMDDFETRKTLRSAVETKSIRDNMEEARTGLSKDGGVIYSSNYLSERGTVQFLLTKKNEDNLVTITPIVDKQGNPTWNLYSKEDIDKIKRDTDDWSGEYLCEPSASLDSLFDRETLSNMPISTPIKEIAGQKIFYDYNPSHRYGSGQDISGGVGLDSSTMVIIDFSTIPARVVSTYANNEIRPDVFGNEIARQGERFGECIVAPENNKFDMVIGTLKDIYPTEKLFKTQRKSSKVKDGEYTDYGWNTNSLTKPKMFYDLSKAVEDGLLILSDEDLINEAKSYSRDDLMDKSTDPRLITRHYDLVTACFVEGTMVLTNKGQRPIETLRIGDMVLTRKGYKRIKKTIALFKPVITNIGLTGTVDHPVFCNNNKVKDLSSIEKDDILYIWNNKQIKRKLYTEVLSIIDTQTQNKDNIGFIFKEELNGKSLQNIYIEKFGKIIMEKYQRVLSFTIKMVTHSIMRLKTLKCYQEDIMQYCICLVRKEKNLLETVLKTIGKNLTMVFVNIIRIRKKRSLNVLFAGMTSSQLQAMLNIVQQNVEEVSLITKERSQRLKKPVKSVEKGSLQEFHIRKDAQKSVLVLEGSIFIQKLVQFVEKHLKLLSFGKKDVQKNAQKNTKDSLKRLKEEKDIQKVYNIEVEDCPEYFANNILVHNCAIAFQMKDFAEYPSRKEDEIDRININRRDRLNNDYMDQF